MLKLLAVVTLFISTHTYSQCSVATKTEASVNYSTKVTNLAEVTKTINTKTTELKELLKKNGITGKKIESIRVNYYKEEQHMAHDTTCHSYNCNYEVDLSANILIDSIDQSVKMYDDFLAKKFFLDVTISEETNCID